MGVQELTYHVKSIYLSIYYNTYGILHFQFYAGWFYHVRQNDSILYAYLKIKYGLRRYTEYKYKIAREWTCD